MRFSIYTELQFFTSRKSLLTQSRNKLEGQEWYQNSTPFSWWKFSKYTPVFSCAAWWATAGLCDQNLSVDVCVYPCTSKVYAKSMPIATHVAIRSSNGLTIWVLSLCIEVFTVHILWFLLSCSVLHVQFFHTITVMMCSMYSVRPLVRAFGTFIQLCRYGAKRQSTQIRLSCTNSKFVSVLCRTMPICLELLSKTP